MIIILNILGGILAAAIIWWFWLSKPKAVRVNKETVQITVKDGVYVPSRIEVDAKVPLTLEFMRKDTSGCSEYVIFSSLGIHEKLPLNKSHQIYLPVLEPGVYTFNCQMNMYHGELVVK